ncbi:MAG: AEC family transporter [Elusimicrobiota bacterium]|jgi:predicted permease|nr:AEC family transporter [Elusimicrobiota bacterium]
MEIFLFSFNAIAPILFIMALGWFIAWRGHIGEEDKLFLNKLCFKYLLPFQLFCSTVSIDFYAEFNSKMVIFCISAILALAFIGFCLFTLTMKDRHKRCIFIVCAFRSNNIIYALPLAINMFGDAGLKAAAMLVPITIIMFNLLSVIAFVYYSQNADTDIGTALKHTLIDICKNPLITSSVLGIVMSLLGVSIPQFLEKGVFTVGALGPPMALLLLGSQIDLKKLTGNIKPVLGLCLMRLVIVPAVIAPFMVYFGFRGAHLGALFVAFAAPCAVTNMIMARMYNVAPEFSAQSVYLTTVLSLATMFCGISLFRWLGLF